MLQPPIPYLQPLVKRTLWTRVRIHVPETSFLLSGVGEVREVSGALLVAECSPFG